MNDGDSRVLRATLAFQTDPERFDSVEEAERHWRRYVAEINDKSVLNRLLLAVMTDESMSWIEKYNCFVAYCPDNPIEERLCREHFERIWLWTYDKPWQEERK